MLLMLLLLPTRMVAQTANGNTSNQAYAEFEKSTGTFTFKCGPKPAGAYDLNEGENLPRWYAQRDKIKTVVFDASFANARPTSCYRWFCYCYNLTTIEGIEYLNTEKVMNMKDMFYRCSALTSLDLSNFNTKNVTDMSYMFCSCSALTTIFVSDKFVTGQVTDSRDMFSGCDKLIGAIKYVEKNTNNKDYANYETGYFAPEGGFPGYAVFDGGTGTLTFRSGPSTSKPERAYDLNVGTSLPGWLAQRENIKTVVFDASFANARLTNCYAWFYGCNNLTTIEGIEYLNTENVTNMGGMFYNCCALTSLNLTSFNTAKVESMSCMFYNCSALTSLNLSNFNTANVTNMSNMFRDCYALTSLDLTSFNTENVMYMSNMFDRCSALTSLDLTNFNTAKVSDMSYMFMGCSALTTIFVSDKFVTDQVTDGRDMFHMCINLIGAIEYDGSKSDHTYANYDNGYFSPEGGFHAYAEFNNATGTLTFSRGLSKPVGAYDLNEGDVQPAWSNQSAKINKVVFDASFANARPTSCYMWFYRCENLTKIEDIENLNTQNVTDMSHMFYRCDGLTSLDVSHFNTQKVEDMSEMFSVCSGLKSLNVSHFDTQNVKDMNSMFYSCERLTLLDVSNFNTQNVENMSYMFSCCKGLNSLNLSKFDTQNVTNMSNMFWNSSALTTIYASDKFVTTKVSSGSEMFKGCKSLKDYSDSKTDHTYANCGPDGYFTHGCGYAEFDNATGTLTFRYKGVKPAEAYDLNVKSNNPGWQAKKIKIKKVVFDASFANARPTSCCLWFADCFYLTEIEGIENLNTEKVTNMGSMFSGCFALTSLDVSNFNTEKVTYMSSMFEECRKLSLLDLSNFNTANVMGMSSMFSGCSTLQTIFASDKFVTDKVFDGVGMFFDCKNLKGFIDYISNTDKDDNKYANYKTGYFTKLVGKNGEKKIGAAGEALTTENLVLDDGKDFVAYDQFAAKNAFYIRVIPEGSTWGTLCLPFAIDQSQETECKFYRLTGIDNDNECITLESYEGAEIPAGTPVLFKMNENEPTLSISVQNVGIVKEPVAGTNVTEPEAETASDVNLVGSFTKIGGNGNLGLDKYDYIIGKNKFWRVSDLDDGNRVGIKPMRAYIHPATAALARAAMLSIGKGDGTTAIDNLNAISNDANAEYYDANGRRTNGLQKGLNIVKRGSKTYKIMVK